MNFSLITLEAKHVPTTASYLSELLDLDIQAITEEEVILKGGNINFKVVSGSSSKNKGNTVFDFFVDKEEDLQKISQKASFLSYRFGQAIKALAKKANSLEICDPDGRRWRFMMNSI